MAETKRFSLTPQLDLQQIIYEAQHRWLRPAEICEILQNYKKFRIEPEPPNRPPSGSLYLFDRKVLRYFRKDGHNWRKKKDGKTVKEAHERLKAGSVDVLHCYYAHGEENENFQRRSYWMLEQNLMHIVLVHYLEVKVGHKLNSNRSRDVEVLQVNPIDSPVCSGSISNYSHVPSLATDVESPNSAQNSEYEDAESDNYQTSSRYDAVIKMQQYDDGQITGIQFSDSYVPGPTIGSQCSIQGTHAAESNSGFSTVTQDALSKVFYETSFGSEFSDSKAQFDLSSWDEVLEHATALQMASFQPSGGFAEPATGKSKVNWDQYDENLIIQDNSSGLGKSALKLVATDADSSGASIINMENGTYMDEMVNHPSLKQPALNILQGEALKKHDSFSRWMSKELGEVEDSLKKSSFGVYWSSVGNDCVVEDSGISSQESVDAYMFSLSLSQDQLFSIIEFSPNWVYAGSKTKVLITGKFLNNEDVFKCKWSCMFGEIEVPAEVVGDGLLCCCAPAHKSGRVPFYVTCSDRLACSEVREFEFREDNSHFTDLTDVLLHIRLDKLLSLGLLDYQTSDTNILENNAQLKNEMSPIKIEATDDWSTLLKLSELNTFSTDNAKDPREALLQDKLDNWLLCKVSEDGKGPNIWDEEGQGVLHLAAALGYDWALEPTVTAGVNINFRDAHGWTALHWAAFCGRERTVGALIAMGAAPGLLTDPTPEFPSGRTPSDLASANGHKGISGFLAESTLTDHLSCLTIESKGSDIPELTTLAGANVVESGSHSLEVADGDVQAGLTLKDSLNAVRNASQAAARIYQAYRVHSFQRKKLVEYRNDKSGVSDERALSLISVKSQKPGQCDMPLHAAAVRIQNKFRGWKGRKEFLVIRQRIVKIQAHVRGHQVRKRYRNVVWSVGIVEKVILRWRRKGSGLRGFRSEGRSEGLTLTGLLEGNTTQSQPAKEDDYDFLQEGRKQTEARMQKALERVKSMVQYPEAREQYRRLLTVVTEFQESKAMRETIMNESEAADDDFMVELEELWDDHTL